MNGTSKTREVDRRRGIYLFCVASRSSIAGVAGLAPDADSEIASLEYRDVVAVHSAVNLDDFVGPLAEERLQQLKWVAPRAWRHEEVVEHVMAYSPVLPTRFGTLFSSREMLEEVLAQSYNDIKAFLDYVREREEWAVKGWASLKKIEAAQSAGVSAPAGGGGGGAQYLLERRSKAEAAKRARRWLRQQGKAISMQLQSDGAEFRPRNPQPCGICGRAEEMIFNWAFLVKRDTRETFRSQVAEISGRCAVSGITLETTGPWPPYSFSPVISAVKG